MQMLPTCHALDEAAQPRNKFSISSHVLPGLMTGLDCFVVLSIALASFLLVVGDSYEDGGYYAAAVGFVWLISILLMNLAGLYDLEPIMRPLAFADKIVIAFATTFLFLLAAAFSLKVSATFSRVWVTSFAVGSCMGTLLVRIIASRVLGHLADARVFTRNIVIAGGGEQARKLLAHIQTSQPRFISVLGIFTDTAGDQVDGFGPCRLLGNLDTLNAYVRTNCVDDVIIALPWSADDQIMAMMRKLRELPVNAYLSSDLVGFRLPFRQTPAHFGDIPLVEVMGRPLAGWGIVRKVALDYGLAIVLVILLLPVMALVALAIKLDSKGPVLFRQQRYGFVNKVFWIRKFRTMKHIEVSSKQTLQATRNDPRVTRVGRFLRRTSLDELPQLFNVLAGAMSLVGPRPHAIDHNEEYARTIRDYFARHRVKPGITGWAQVNGLRGETKTVEQMEARVKRDVEYAENWSLLFDLKILAMTVLVWLSGRNAY
jgi:Undecaprenyl-phosphate glucose phosphotransferase